MLKYKHQNTCKESLLIESHTEIWVRYMLMTRCLMVKDIQLAAYCLNMPSSQNTMQHNPFKHMYDIEL